MASVSAHLALPCLSSCRKAVPWPGPGSLILLAGLLAALLALAALPARAAEPAVRLVDEVFVVTRSDAAVDVFQLFTLVNEGAGAAEHPLLPVAEDAVRLQILHLEGDGVAVPLVERVGPGEPPRDPVDLAPGERRTYQATYRLWQSNWPLALKRPLPYMSDGATFLARPGELELTGLKVGHAGTEQAQGVSLDLYRVEPAEPVDRWQVLIRPAGVKALPVLAGAQKHNPVDALPGDSRWWLVGLGAVMVGALSLRVRRRRFSARPASGPESGGEDGLASWVDRLAGLDLAFQRGELAEEPYRQQREALLAAYRRAVTDPSDLPARVPDSGRSVDRA